MKAISFFNRLLVPLLFIIILLSTLTGCHLLHHRHGHHNRHYDHDNRHRNDSHQGHHRRHSQNGKKEYYKDRHHRY